MSLSRVRGVRDILEQETLKIERIFSTFRRLTQKSSYDLITLPTLEESTLYLKSLGETSDIVSKEMFKIQEQSYVLRPEGTAGAIRAYLMNCNLGEKKQWSYFGSMFRHEKPQKSRFREFFQFGVESISNSFNSCSDAEVIILANDVLQALNVKSVLQINTLGDEQARIKFNIILEKYLKGKKLSKNSQIRMEKGKFLRILDSKELEDQETIETSPSILECLDPASLRYFEEIQEVLKEAQVDFVYNPRLVRGLDYYSNVCFEFLKQNQALVGGGRYDNLGGMVEKDKNIGGIGWAAGVDRIAEWISNENQGKTVGIIPVSEENTRFCMKVARTLRKLTDFQVKMKTEAKTVKHHLSYLKNLNPDWLIFIGEDEIAKNQAKVKKCESGEHFFVSLPHLLKDPELALTSL